MELQQVRDKLSELIAECIRDIDQYDTDLDFGSDDGQHVLSTAGLATAFRYVLQLLAEVP